MQAGQHLQVRRHIHVPDQRELNQEHTALLELLDRTLDKGVLIEGHACLPALGIEVLTLDFRAFVASCEKYLQYADAVSQTMHVGELDDH